jgi:hypothetical protein
MCSQVRLRLSNLIPLSNHIIPSQGMVSRGMASQGMARRGMVQHNRTSLPQNRLWVRLSRMVNHGSNRMVTQVMDSLHPPRHGHRATVLTLLAVMPRLVPMRQRFLSLTVLARVLTSMVIKTKVSLDKLRLRIQGTGILPEVM